MIKKPKFLKISSCEKNFLYNPNNSEYRKSFIIQHLPDLGSVGYKNMPVTRVFPPDILLEKILTPDQCLKCNNSVTSNSNNSFTQQ